MQICITFIETLMHSVWQSALLYILFYAFQLAYTNIHPQQKRNFLFHIVALQLVLSCYTFYSIYTHSSFFSSTNNRGPYLIFQTLLNTYKIQITLPYFGYVSFKIIQISYQWVKFNNHYKNNLIKVNALLYTFTEQKAFQLGIKRKISIWYSNSIQTPITFGYFKPIILLPISLLSNISTENIEAIILHELTHIKHKDYLLNWFLVFLDIIFGFNPFMQLTINQIKLEREKNCDLQVVNFNYNKISYAETLLNIAQNSKKQKVFQVGAVFSRNHLLKRIQFFCLNTNPSNLKHLNKFYFSLSIIFAFFITSIIPTVKPINFTKSNILFAQNKIFDNKKALYFSHNDNFINLKTIKTVVNSIYNTTLKKEIASKFKPVETLSPIIEDENIFKQVSLIDTLVNTKEFIYNIETPEGEIIQRYKLIYRNDEWVLEPIWIMVTKNRKDSINNFKLDSLTSLLDNIQ